MGKLDGKTALITGAGSGIGRATAVLFAREGAKVAIVDYAPTGGQETSTMVKESGGEAMFIEADVSKTADVKRMVQATVEAYGRLDILYNNAGFGGRWARTAEVTEEDWDLVIGINLKGVFLGSKYAIPLMLDQGSGVIINTASIGGLFGFGAFGLPAYAVSKAGVIQLTKIMAKEYGKQNIRVNCICPGAIPTPMTEQVLYNASGRQSVIELLALERIGQPEEVAQAALYLASDDSSFVTGTTLVVDGGQTAAYKMPSRRSK
ncbi:SDR family NAD(P)-dependent oxidoreductase [Chloroflexota bacterium]